MEANAPEKIYFTSTEDGTHYYTEGIPFERNYIEYTRIDAFIEKALRWMISKGGVNDVLSREMIEDFKKYMEE